MCLRRTLFLPPPTAAPCTGAAPPGIAGSLGRGARRAGPFRLETLVQSRPRNTLGAGPHAVSSSRTGCAVPALGYPQARTHTLARAHACASARSDDGVVRARVPRDARIPRDARTSRCRCRAALNLVLPHWQLDAWLAPLGISAPPPRPAPSPAVTNVHWSRRCWARCWRAYDSCASQAPSTSWTS